MRWFISDLHIDHAKVLLGTRGEAFPTIEEWQKGIISGIRRCCQKGDQLFLLGDFAMKDPQKWKMRLGLRGVDCWIIVGNHDPAKEQLEAAFGSSRVRDTFMTKCCDEDCFLSHYAHAYWPKSHRQAFHLYGHTHGMREATLDAIWPERRSMEVCPEVIHELTGEWRPISEEEVYSRLSVRKGHDPVDFYKKLRGEYVDDSPDTDGKEVHGPKGNDSVATGCEDG